MDNCEILEKAEIMTDPTSKDILDGINDLKKRINHLEWLIIESKFVEDDPTPEELVVTREYEKEKSDGRVEFSKFV